MRAEADRQVAPRRPGPLAAVGLEDEPLEPLTTRPSPARRGARRQHGAGENPLTTCRGPVGTGGGVHGPDRPTTIPPTRRSAHAGRRDRVVNGFSPGEQPPLCPVKFFGIMTLFGGSGHRRRNRGRPSKKTTIEFSLLPYRETRRQPGRQEGKAPPGRPGRQRRSVSDPRPPLRSEDLREGSRAKEGRPGRLASSQTGPFPLTGKGAKPRRPGWPEPARRADPVSPSPHALSEGCA